MIVPTATATYCCSNSLCPLFNNNFGFRSPFLPQLAGFGAVLGVSGADFAGAQQPPSQAQSGNLPRSLGWRGQASPLFHSNRPAPLAPEGIATVATHFPLSTKTNFDDLIRMPGLNFGDVFVGLSGNQSFYGLEGPANTLNLSTVPVVVGQPVLFVLRIDFLPGNDTLSLYLNPTSGQPEPATSDVLKTNLDLGTVDCLTINNYGGFTTDEIRIGSSFDAVTPLASICRAKE